MKKLSTAIISLVLVLLMATLVPVQALADTPNYISEIKVAMGGTGDLKGYIVLSDDKGNPVDVNQTGGSTSYGAKGNKSVYIGYKTTKNKDDAVTDLAVMNMKGGYNLDDYEYLMNTQLKSQVIPFVDNFLTAIKEYRENYYSKNKNNKERAEYSYRMLNKLTDDDCGGKKLGDLLLNETKYEMGDEKYNKLSEEEKKNHADIVTIIAQANGQATFLFENLITRASDTSTADNWLERFENTRYQDLLDATGKAPTDARKEVARKYDDDATSLIDSLDDFRKDLEGYDDALNYTEENDVDGAIQTLEDFVELDVDETDSEELLEAMEEHDKANEIVMGFYDAAETITIHDYLEDIEYGDGTMLDFFLQSKEDFEDDTTMIYPLVASLSKGQRAGLEFISIKELIASAMTDTNNLKEAKLKAVKTTSIYEGVDRRIYEKGGVALTSDALRKDAMARMQMPGEKGLSGLSIALITLASVSAAAFLISLIPAKVLSNTAKHFAENLNGLAKPNASPVKQWTTTIPGYEEEQLVTVANEQCNVCDQKLMKYLGDKSFEYTPNEYLTSSERAAQISASRSTVAKYVSVGLAVVMVILISWSIYSSLSDMKEYYKVDYTPIPRFMIDEKDLTGYNSRGDKIILKNQTAYYAAAECNRSTGAEYYKSVGTFADLNGDVGAQWLALYYVKNEAEDPILVDSLKVVIDSRDIPAGYETGVHMFGEESAFNLNTYPYDWNKSAKSIQIYFKRDKGAKKKAGAAGSNFTAVTLALAGGGGLILGAAISALAMTATGKKKEKAQTA